MPDLFHCHLMFKDHKGEGHYINDLSEDVLFKDILLPLVEGKQFIFDGYMVSPNQVKRLKVVKTPAASQQYVDRHYHEMDEAGIADLVTNPASIVLSKGTDITNEVLEQAKRKVIEKEKKNVTTNAKEPQPNRKFFVVHGHDMASMHELCRILKDEFGIEPVVLSEQPNIGLDTLISKFERLAEDCSAVAVLLTPDDKAGEKENDRARQNVIFELGYFLGKLRKPEERRIMVFHKGEVDVPSDISGVVYYHYEKSVTEAYYHMKKQISIWGY